MRHFSTKRHGEDSLTCITSFAELFGGNQATDRVRNQNVPKTGPTLDYLGMFLRPYRSVTRFDDFHRLVEEAFTSENWIVGLRLSPATDIQILTDILRFVYIKSRRKTHWDAISKVPTRSRRVRNASVANLRRGERSLSRYPKNNYNIDFMDIAVCNYERIEAMDVSLVYYSARSHVALKSSTLGLMRTGLRENDK